MEDNPDLNEDNLMEEAVAGDASAIYELKRRAEDEAQAEKEAAYLAKYDGPSAQIENEVNRYFATLAGDTTAENQEDDDGASSEHSLETRAAMGETEAIHELKMIAEEEADQEKYERLMAEKESEEDVDADGEKDVSEDQEGEAVTKPEEMVIEAQQPIVEEHPEAAVGEQAGDVVRKPEEEAIKVQEPVVEPQAEEVATIPEEGIEIEDDEDEDEDEAEEEEEEEEKTLEEAKTELNDAIDSVKGAGIFASSGAIPYLPDPHLTVDAGRPLMLPLGQNDVQRIVAAAHRYLPGPGTETPVDQTIRCSCALNINQFYISNPAFLATVDTCFTQACKDLGLEHNRGGLQAHFDRLMLYDPGVVFD